MNKYEGYKKLSPLAYFVVYGEHVINIIDINSYNNIDFVVWSDSEDEIIHKTKIYHGEHDYFKSEKYGRIYLEQCYKYGISYMDTFDYISFVASNH